jgi:predicted Zn-dependent protease
LGAIAQYDRAQTATHNSTTTSAYEVAAWGSLKTVTWSFATANYSSQGKELYSGTILDPTQQAVISQAVQQWATATGIKFVQVQDSQYADMRIGWGDLNTATSGVVGITSFTDSNSAYNPGVIVRLEDPTQQALTNSSGQLAYTNTSANLLQVALHEIGHALGLADNIDPNSVMYYESVSTNQTLDSTDKTGAQAIYGSTPVIKTTPLSGTTTGLNGVTLQNFASIDKLDITNLGFGANTSLGFTENANNNFGTLSVSDGTHSASIILLGQYIASGFTKGADAGSGTMIAYTLPANQSPPNALAVTH